MKVTLESTDKIVTVKINGRDVPARIWQGETAGGVQVHAYITRIAVAADSPPRHFEEFERELKETAPMRPDVEGIPARLLL